MKTREIALIIAGRLKEAKKVAAGLLPPDAKIMVFGNPRSTTWVFLARQYKETWHAILAAREENNDRPRSHERH